MNKQEILVIDDEPQIRKLLQIILESNGFGYTGAATGKEGLAIAANHPPDLILLDLGLPDRNGHDLLLDLRGWFEKPILILSVQEGEGDIVSALEHGADDYLTKPFRAGELLARIRTSLRRSIGASSNAKLVHGDLLFDFDLRIVYKEGKPIHLTVTEYNLLSLLARNEGRVLTHQYILRQIWGTAFQAETQYLRVYIAHLRKKIEKSPEDPVYIRTESGVGYRFTSEG